MGAKRTQYYCPFLTPPPLPPPLSRVFPRTPEVFNGCSSAGASPQKAPHQGSWPSLRGLKGSDGPCVTTRSRSTTRQLEGAGCRPPLPLSFATHLWQSVGAGHARPAALLCHPFAFCIVGRGLDPSATSRRREPQKPFRPSLPLGHLPCEGRLLSRASPAQKRPPCQRGLAAPADWGIPTGFAGLPVTPADGQESLRLACARHLPLTREAPLAGFARAKGSPHRGAGRASRPEGLCRAFRRRTVTPLPPNPLLSPLSSLLTLNS